MAGVEQPQLHQLERLDVADELDARAGKIGPTRGEAILDHALRERLGHNRPGVTHPERRGDHIAVGPSFPARCDPPWCGKERYP